MFIPPVLVNNVHVKMHYSGEKKYFSLKFEGVMTPNGLLMIFFFIVLYGVNRKTDQGVIRIPSLSLILPAKVFPKEIQQQLTSPRSITAAFSLKCICIAQYR